MLFDLIRDIRQGNEISIEFIITQILVLLLIIFLILPFHEWAHAFAAKKLGDKSIQHSGRLTFNPLNHIDPMGSLMMFLVGFGWAKAVPIHPQYFKNPKKGMAITAAAGPIANLVAALAGGLLYNGIMLFFTKGVAYSATALTVATYITYFFYYYISINIMLAVFNMFPIPPLDGSKVLFAFLPDRIVATIYQYERYFMMLLFIILFLGILTGPISYLTNAIFQGINFITSLPFRPFM